MLANLMIQLGNHKNAQLEEGMLRHMVLNSIRSIKKKYGSTYGELIIAADTKNYWRRAVFPYYKASRRKAQEESELDWGMLFDCLRKIRQELHDNFPYRVLAIEGAEADDVIATLCHEFGVSLMHTGAQPILIVSGDKDFIQLHDYANVKQYDPVRKKFITHPNPDKYRREHIIRGDKGDGVPNFLSPDNSLVIGLKQKSITQKKLDKWLLSEPPSDIDSEALRNWYRNRQLIDLSFIPDEIQREILTEYESQAGKDRSKLFNYFIANRLKFLMESIHEF